MTDFTTWLSPLQLPMPATRDSVNAYLIAGPSGNAIVDTGLGDRTSRDCLAEALQRHGLTFGDIDTVVCTHHHADHAGLGRTFQEVGARVLMSRKEAALLADFMDHPERDGEKASCGGRHELPEGLSRHIQAIFPIFRKLCEPFIPEVALAEGDMLDLGGIPFEVLAVPGHTPGHVALWQTESDVVLVGDCVITPNATQILPGPNMVNDADQDQFSAFIRSLERLKQLGAQTAFSGHGQRITDLPHQAQIIKNHLLQDLEKVAGALRDQPLTALELSNGAADKRLRAFPIWLSFTRTLVYLDHLVKQGRAETVETERGIMYRAGS